MNGRDRYRYRADVLEQGDQGLAAARRGVSADNAIAGVLERAAAAQSAMPAEFGPPFVDKPARELLGDVLLSIDRPRRSRRAAYTSGTQTHAKNRPTASSAPKKKKMTYLTHPLFPSEPRFRSASAAM